MRRFDEDIQLARRSMIWVKNTAAGAGRGPAGGPAGRAGLTVGLLRSADFVPAGAGRAPAQVSASWTGVPADNEDSWWELEL